MASLPSASTENQCSDIVTDAGILFKNKDVSSDEEGDMDFNLLLEEALFLEASLSLCSEIEACEFEGDVVATGKYYSPVVHFTNAPHVLHDDAVENGDPGQQMVRQAAEESEGNIATKTFNDVVSENEDAIWKRTRARYSLVESTLDELGTFLQETDDEDDLHQNIDDEEEYRKFLASVLLDGDETYGSAPENENFDEDEYNDADFELEREEALGSDGDDVVSQEHEHERAGRRPETRQKKRHKNDTRQNQFSGQTSRPLHPNLPYAPICPLSAPIVRNDMNGSTSFAKNNHFSGFTPKQIGQLHCLLYEHVQLLIQVFSLSILEPCKQHISTQVHTLLSEMLQKRDQVLASPRRPYPSSYFSSPNIYPAVTVQNTSESSAISGGVPPTESFFWVPSISENVFSVIDVAPLSLVQSYMADVSIVVQEHCWRQLETTCEAIVEKECLFPFHSTTEASGVSSDPTPVPDKARNTKSKKRIAAALAERSKKQSIALVPKPIASLALRFFPIFNPDLFPHTPPAFSVANRVLFTEAEDGLLARGIIVHNTNWKEIQKNYLPCKTPHQIFVRQKNLASSRTADNPVKAVKRMKNSPLTPQETCLIEEGLELFKMDWMAIGKCMVPHRDPSLLSRQYRTAVGKQKADKLDELKREKRRLYESKRRKSKALNSRLNSTAAGQNREGLSTVGDANPFPGFPSCRTVSDKENCSANNAGGENNSGDYGGNDEAYWGPALPNLGENQPVEFSTLNRSVNLNTSSHLHSAKIFTPSDNFFSNFLKSIELTSSSTRVDFHPLQQRLDDGIIPHPPPGSSTPHETDVSAVPRCRRGHEEVEESVTFECEEMTDSEEGGSDSDHAETMQNEVLVE